MGTEFQAVKGVADELAEVIGRGYRVVLIHKPTVPDGYDWAVVYDDGNKVYHLAERLKRTEAHAIALALNEMPTLTDTVEVLQAENERLSALLKQADIEREAWKRWTHQAEAAIPSGLKFKTTVEVFDHGTGLGVAVAVSNDECACVFRHAERIYVDPFNLKDAFAKVASLASEITLKLQERVVEHRKERRAGGIL